ncbi:hypothetical protein [Desulforhopalus singaporensis]|uniref:hypothetical protein n=1 Tax=Desulforhopalus singaporensis TaxID=91360 RepID=UPI0015A40873|nr:hypothetical protein [Desulforhopalus singaporensis]
MMLKIVEDLFFEPIDGQPQLKEKNLSTTLKNNQPSKVYGCFLRTWLIYSETKARIPRHAKN